MPINVAGTVPQNVREIPSGSTVGGFLDSSVGIRAKTPLFVRLTNQHDSTVQCTLKSDIKGKDEGNTFNIQMNSGAAVLFQIDTSADADTDADRPNTVTIALATDPQDRTGQE